MVFVDLRSDTVTRPGPAMRAAMAGAEVGDDVFGEDPTVRRLEEAAAALMGKEAALLVPSGTMANQVALGALGRPGDEVIAEAGAHCYRFEGGAAAALWGLSILPVAGRRGILEPEAVAAAIQPDNPHYPVSRVLALENTSNTGGGSVYPLARLEALGALARERGLFVHLDGARIFNAALAGGYPPAAAAAAADTVSFCLSKGLGAPAGSLVCASAELIRRARRLRKRLGGGMRQAGILAAAGLYALEHHVARLAEDHARARRLAGALAGMAGVVLDPEAVETNIVVFEIAPGRPTPQEAAARLASLGVGMVPFGPGRMRAVTHLDVDDAGIEAAINACAAVLG